MLAEFYYRYFNQFFLNNLVSAPLHQILHHFCSTDNSGCRAQPKLFVDPKRNIRMPSSFSNPWSMHFFWKFQIVLVELYKHYWPWNKSSEKVHYKSREKERKTRNALRSKSKKKQKVSLKKLERT